MSDIVLTSASLPDSTIISNDFIDHIMPSANGEFVKVYIYLLRSFAANQNVSISGIADLFEHTEKDVVRALKYWEKNHLLLIEYNEQKKISGLELLGGTGSASAVNMDMPPVSEDKPSGKKVRASKSALSSSEAREIMASDSMAINTMTVTSSKDASPISGTMVNFMVTETVEGSSLTNSASPVPEKREYTLSEIEEFTKDDAISELFFIIETYMRHPLSSNDTQTILYWYSELAFSPDLIEYLVEYCITKGHSSIRYMDKVAIAWKEQNITSVTEAKGNAQTHSKAYYAVMKSFGITGRNLVDSEMEYIKKWTKEYAFDLAIIEEACKRTMTAIHQPSFEYTDKILSSWFSSKAMTMKDIEAMDASYAKNKRIKPDMAPQQSKNKFNNFTQRDYDYNQLEKMLLTTPVQ